MPPNNAVETDAPRAARGSRQSEKSGKGYQILINEPLKSYLGLSEQPVTQELIRQIVREELASHGSASPAPVTPEGVVDISAI